jgi:hypothetical protein
MFQIDPWERAAECALQAAVDSTHREILTDVFGYHSITRKQLVA